MPFSRCEACSREFYAETEEELIERELEHYQASYPREGEEGIEHMCKKFYEGDALDNGVWDKIRFYGNNRLLRSVAYNGGRNERDF